MGGALAATTGLSTFGHELPTDQMTIIPGLAGSDVPFLQVVYPTANSVPLLSMSFFDSVTGAKFSVADVPLTAVIIPEPGTLATAGMGLIGFVALASPVGLVS